VITVLSIIGPVAFILAVLLGVPVAYEAGFRRGKKRGPRKAVKRVALMSDVNRRYDV